MSQRLAAAGISPITHQAGLAMSTRFCLGQMGQMRVSQALSNLRQYFGFDRVLWFGFGHKSFLALLTEHQAGVNCAALCASLAEAYGVDQSAQYLQALWRVQGLSEPLEPSRSQFRALVNGCSGLLLATPFPDVIRRMGDPYATRDYFPVSVANSRSDDWAKAVDAIFQISKGNLKAIRVYGGLDIAFLAAIAHWLFDLRVWVELSDGTVTFSSCRSPEQANVYLHYADMDHRSKALLKISSTTFLLRSVKDLIIDDGLFHEMNFRIQWNTCLSDLFGDEVDNMLENVVLIGKIFGAIARIYEALRKCEVDVGGLSRTHFINYQPAGYGRGFIDTVCNFFPEIGNSMFRTTALKVLQTDVPTCVNQIRDSIGEMIENCCCWRCSFRSREPFQDHRCHVVVIFFIRAVANILSHTDIRATISPSRSGLTDIWYAFRGEWNSGTSRECSKILELVSGLPHADLFDRDGQNYPKDFLLDSLLQGVARVFVGPGQHKEFDFDPRSRRPRQCTAIVKNGVCLWIEALQNLSADPASMAFIHIAPGQIVYKDWTYNSIWDMSHVSVKLIRSLSPVHFGEAPTTIPQKEPDQPHIAVRILAQERAEDGNIKVVYVLNDQTIEQTLQPGIITEELLMATGRVPCPHATTCSDEIALPCWQRRSGWNCADTIDKLPHDSTVGFIWNASSSISKLLAIEGCRTLAWYEQGPFKSSAMMIRSDQCMSCMTRYVETFADQAIWEHFQYYRGKRECFNEDLQPCSLHII